MLRIGIWLNYFYNINISQGCRKPEFLTIYEIKMFIIPNCTQLTAFIMTWIGYGTSIRREDRKRNLL